MRKQILMPDELKSDTINGEVLTYEELVEDNKRLLSELEIAYKNMEQIIEESDREKEITYTELQNKFEALENLYSELSNKENMLIHMEKLSSIGQFITELIHELSSPLTAITLQAQMATYMNISEQTKQQFKVIEQHSERMNNLLARFRAMAYKGKEDFKIFDLNKNLKECLETIEIIKPKNMQITTNLCDKELPVKGDPFQTSQIYLNLAKNAFDAMKNHGRNLTVTSRRVLSSFVRDSDEIGQIFCQKEEDWFPLLDKHSQFALIEFSDEGTGIDNDIMKNLFQPFFTTKERGKGTGLGLSISSDIVIRHRGNLTIKSEIDKGTCFQLILPIQTE